MSPRPWAGRPALALALAKAALVAAGCEGGGPSSADPAPSVGPAPSAAPLAVSTERLVPIASAEAPLLERPADGKRGAAALARAGDLLFLARPEPHPWLRWEGQLPGEARSLAREGELLEVQPLLEHRVLYAFPGDLGPALEVPSARAVCDALAEASAPVPRALSAPCERFLVRKRTSAGRVVAFYGAGTGPGPVAIVAPSGAVRFVVVENLGSARLVESGGAEGRSVLVASTRFSREDGRFTGSSLVPVDVSSDEPRLLPAVALESVDARGGEEVTLRDVRAELGEGTIRVSGEQRVQRRADGKVLRRAPVEETHALFGVAL